MRDKLITELIKELQGPREGAEEVLKGSEDVKEVFPTLEYVIGVIISDALDKEIIEDASRNPDEELADFVLEEGEEEEDGKDLKRSSVDDRLNPRKKPSSFGISFQVKGESPIIEICLTWGRYSRIKENGKFNWSRRPKHFIKEIMINEKEQIELIEDEDGDLLHLKIRKHQYSADENLLTISVINQIEDKNVDAKNLVRVATTCIFQPSLRINILQGELLPKTLELGRNEVLSYLYSDRPTRAKGLMCSAIWEGIDYVQYFEDMKEIFWTDGHHYGEECERFQSPDLRTEFLPLCAISAPDFELDDFANDSHIFSARKLSDSMDIENLTQSLSPLIESYEIWINKNKEEIEGEKSEKGLKILTKIVEDQKILLNRLKKGLEILQNNEEARLCFCFANKSILIQNLWKMSLHHDYEKSDKDFIWRPFQLAFLLLSLNSIIEEDSEEKNILDLLWIPTGGGKTEAYLAIIAFTIAFRRRKAIFSESAEKTGGGTAVISRYTLRLLTVQQYRRTLRMIQASEFLRVFRNPNNTIGWKPDDFNNKDNWIYGSMRFSIGMWVGGAVTPNFLRTNDGAIKNLQGSTGGEGEPAQILRCPSCNSWLSFPKTGIPKGQNQLYFLTKIKEGKTDNRILKEKLIEERLVEDSYSVDLITDDVNEGFLILRFSINNEKLITSEDIREFFGKIEELEVCSLDVQRQGYFGKYTEPDRRVFDKYSDFEILCLNPKCDLNRYDNWKEGVVKSIDENINEIESFPDNLMEQVLPYPLVKGRIPIVAYTVDEQVYSRCPTVIISTADKIARMAYEPRITAIFGDVNCYNPYYGYNKNQSLYRENTTTVQGRNLTVSVQPFKPPELIIQDELHLIEGPLGSMFGLYEASVDLLNNSNIKYIASTATISNAEQQVKVLFNKNLSLFPAYGTSIENSFFVKEYSKEEPWRKDKPGRIYLGVYCPGLGSLTPLIRIYSRLLQTVYNNRDDEEFLRYFWTIVSYFNTIKELGGAESLFKEDIIERLRNIEPTNTRPLHIQSILELSSRINSTEIPQVLEFIERQEKSDEIERNTDVLITTSMFGTGVDISHLSMMVVGGQPKTHSAYIQATGRVGRKRSGLVIAFYKNGRARDLSHYEHFSDYHYRLHLEVEPISVSPFSSGALEKVLGPVIVSTLRNMRTQSVNWYGDDAKIVNSDNSQNDIDEVKASLLRRFEAIKPDDAEGKKRLAKAFDKKINLWKQEIMFAENEDEEYDFFEYCMYRNPEKNIVLGDSLHKKFKKRVVFENSPQSLRSVEDTIGFQVE